MYRSLDLSAYFLDFIINAVPISMVGFIFVLLGRVSDWKCLKVFQFHIVLYLVILQEGFSGSTALFHEKRQRNGLILPCWFHSVPSSSYPFLTHNLTTENFGVWGAVYNNGDHSTGYSNPLTSLFLRQVHFHFQKPGIDTEIFLYHKFCYSPGKYGAELTVVSICRPHIQSPL